MPIFNDKTINIHSGVANDQYDSTPNCFWNNITTDPEKALALQEFIYILKKPEYINLLDQNSKDLYDKVYRFLVESDPNPPYNFTLTDTTTRSSIVLPILRTTIPEDLTHLSPGLLSEASYIFTLFFLSKQLAAATGYESESSGSYDTNYTINPAHNSFSHIFDYDGSSGTNRNDRIYDRIYNGVLFDKRTISIESDPMHIYTQFKNLFTYKDPVNNNPRFEPHNKDQWVEFAKIFDPKIMIGGDNFALDSVKQRMLYLMRKGNVTGITNQRIFITGKIPLTENEIRTYIVEFLKELNKRKEKIINWHTGCFYSAITDGKQQPKSIMLATGEGSSTRGLLNILNLGVILFSYSFANDGTAKVKPENTNAVLYKLPGGIFHFNVFGYNLPMPNDGNQECLTKIKIKNDSLSSSWKQIEFYGNRFTYHGIRPVLIPKIEGGTGLYTEPDHYSSPTLLNTENVNPIDKIISFFWVSNVGAKSIKIGTFYRDTNDLVFSDETSNFPINIELKSGFSQNNGHDEVQLMVNSVKVFRVSETIIINLSDLFADDKFEVQAFYVADLLDSLENLPKLEKLVKLIIDEGYTFNSPSLRGEFVGKESNIIDPSSQSIIADPLYLPTNDINVASQEIRIPDISYKVLRYSFAKITVNIDKTIDIEIVSYVSPVISRLDKRFSSGTFNYPLGAPQIQNFISNYTLFNVTGYTVDATADNGIDTIQIPSFNQGLAVLRSIGVLEAILYRIFLQTDQNSTIKNQLKNVLNSAVSIDKTAESRNVLPSEINTYQLSQSISYDTFKSFRWYSDQADYDQYFHDILD